MSEKLTPGQSAVMRSFAKHGPDSVYLASDLMDLRVCCAMEQRGLIQPFAEEGPGAFELTDAGRAALQHGEGS